MTHIDLKNSIEALIFASDFPLSVKKIDEILEDASADEITETVNTLVEEYEEMGRGLVLQSVAGGYEFVTNPRYYGVVTKMMAGRRKNRLTRAGLETMSIIAYNQPITRGSIEKIRGVDSGGPLKTLLERKLIIIAGREKVPGRPLIYKTSDDFLRYFGLESLTDLPKVEEIEDILQNDRKKETVEIEQLSVESGNSSEEEMRPTDT